MKTLGETTWEKIKVGEVFACKAKCIGWVISYKASSLKAIDLALVKNSYLYEIGILFEWLDFADPLYKLPKKIQKLWKEE